MSEVKVSWLPCIGKLVSKADNVMHFAHLVKQVSVDNVFMTKILLIAWLNRQGIIYCAMKLYVEIKLCQIDLFDKHLPCVQYYQNLVKSLANL